MMKNLRNPLNQFHKVNDVKSKIPLDKIASSIAALGVPGLILVVAMGATGYAGAAALTAALASLGPGGMIGGIAILGVIGLITKGISQYGLQAIFTAVVNELKVRGETKDSILIKIEEYPVSKDLKLKLKEHLNESDA
ncbi:MAG: hypothetical protein KH221_02835 [Atopobium sp.]|jgi:hypothetical protein rflaF_02228|nr:hypothetical protein [Atopobium sp.]